ncbi:hypothetical protein FQA39_LY14418 [Lamprigera yunnana]|nr:hypothetical protein FQA39_LY14418 [Lamprigera yunnana]
MTRKTCTDHSHIDFVLRLCREFQSLHTTKSGKVWGTSAPDVNLFLKYNGITLEQIKPLIQMTRNKMPRTRTSSMCSKLKQTPLTSTANLGVRLRNRRHIGYNNFVDTSGDDDSNHVTPIRKLRSGQNPKRDPHLWNSGRPKRNCNKQRASADERLVLDNRNYYKVELMTHKLRSIRDRKIKSPISEESEDDKVYNFHRRLKKKRHSEITLLNNEAENFIFPNLKEDTSSDNETDVTDTSNRKKELPNKQVNKILKKEIEEESSMDSISSELSVVKKKRRLTQAEAFILDNQRYYKFETPGSRLRYQGSYLSPITSKNNGEYIVKHSRIKDEVKHSRIKEEKTPEKPNITLGDLKFSFEVVPNTEPWYRAFQRQDKGEECYTCYNYCSGYKPFLLPYEMGPLPPLNPKVCYYAYNKMKIDLLDDTGPSTSEACSTPDISATNTLKTDYNSSTGEDTNEDLSTDTMYVENIYRKSTRRKTLTGKNPRKSPRKHASTLAILSSLIHQRKRREHCKKHKVAERRTKYNLSVIVEEVQQEVEPDYDELTKDVDDMLLNAYKDIKLEEDQLDEGVNVHCRSSAVECLEDYINGDDIVCNNGVRKDKLNNIIRKPNRKKKKNRTGWPNKNRRPVFRKDGSDSRDGAESVRFKNTCVDSEENSSDNNFNKRNKNNSFSKLLNNKINGDVQVNKLNGEICFKNVSMPKRKEHRESSSDNCAEVVIPSVGDKIDCVNVDLAKWETAEKLLAAKIRLEDINNDLLFQPIVRVQKLDSHIEEKCIERQLNMPQTETIPVIDPNIKSTKTQRRDSECMINQRKKQRSIKSGRKRTKSFSGGGLCKINYMRPILPTRFLLGGNIRDPLNLSSLQDEEVNRAMNAITPKSSPVPTPPQKKGQVEVIIPPNIKDPLNLVCTDNEEYEQQLCSPLKKCKKKRVRKKRTSSGTSEVADADHIGCVEAKTPESNTDSAKIPEVAETVIKPKDLTLELKKEKTKRKSEEHHKDIVKKFKYANKDKIVSPVVPQPGGWFKRTNSRRDLHFRDNRLQKGVEQDMPSFKERNKQFQYGNYNRYYGYRNQHSEVDLRLLCFSNYKQMFVDKDILDIGCNIGHITLSIARDFNARSVVGVDIDKKLIEIARKNIRHYVKSSETPPHNNDEQNNRKNSFTKETDSSRFPKNVTFKHGNYVLDNDALLSLEQPQFDVILCLSITKWIHLNWGDAGIKQAFRRMYAQLRPGGKLILEPQNWASYKSKKKLTEKIYQNYIAIQFFPENFTQYLLSSEVGFAKSEILGFPQHQSRGFQRPIQIYTKSQVFSSERSENSYQSMNKETPVYIRPYSESFSVSNTASEKKENVIISDEISETSVQ